MSPADNLEQSLHDLTVPTMMFETMAQPYNASPFQHNARVHLSHGASTTSNKRHNAQWSSPGTSWRYAVPHPRGVDPLPGYVYS